MNRIVSQLDKSYKLMEKRNWDTLYISVDIHDTILESTYSTEISKVPFRFALETLQLLSKRKEIVLILWTCSKKEDITEYVKYFSENNINFKYVNSNPEVQDKSYADYSEKFYANLILDDKAGFSALEDWEELFRYLENKYKV